MAEAMWGPRDGEQEEWGGADIAIDANSGDSQWTTPGTTHEVIAGENWSDLAVYYGTSVQALQEANPGPLIAGETIRIDSR